MSTRTALFLEQKKDNNLCGPRFGYGYGSYTKENLQKKFRNITLNKLKSLFITLATTDPFRKYVTYSILKGPNQLKLNLSRILQGEFRSGKESILTSKWTTIQETLFFISSISSSSSSFSLSPDDDLEQSSSSIWIGASCRVTNPTSQYMTKNIRLDQINSYLRLEQAYYFLKLRTSPSLKKKPQTDDIKEEWIFIARNINTNESFEISLSKNTDSIFIFLPLLELELEEEEEEKSKKTKTEGQPSSVTKQLQKLVSIYNRRSSSLQQEIKRLEQTLVEIKKEHTELLARKLMIPTSVEEERKIFECLSKRITEGTLLLESDLHNCLERLRTAELEKKTIPFSSTKPIMLTEGGEAVMVVEPEEEGPKSEHKEEEKEKYPSISKREEEKQDFIYLAHLALEPDEETNPYSYKSWTREFVRSAIQKINQYRGDSDYFNYPDLETLYQILMKRLPEEEETKVTPTPSTGEIKRVEAPIFTTAIVVPNPLVTTPTVTSSGKPELKWVEEKAILLEEKIPETTNVKEKANIIITEITMFRDKIKNVEQNISFSDLLEKITRIVGTYGSIPISLREVEKNLRTEFPSWKLDSELVQVDQELKKLESELKKKLDNANIRETEKKSLQNILLDKRKRKIATSEDNIVLRRIALGEGETEEETEEEIEEEIVGEKQTQKFQTNPLITEPGMQQSEKRKAISAPAKIPETIEDKKKIAEIVRKEMTIFAEKIRKGDQDISFSNLLKTIAINLGIDPSFSMSLEKIKESFRDKFRGLKLNLDFKLDDIDQALRDLESKLTDKLWNKTISETEKKTLQNILLDKQKRGILTLPDSYALSRITLGAEEEEEKKKKEEEEKRRKVEYEEWETEEAEMRKKFRLYKNLNVHKT